MIGYWGEAGVRVDCVIMAGGRGSRLGGVEKPLVKVCGEPMLLRLLRAARPVCKRILLVYSNKTPVLAALCGSGALEGVECIEGEGEYVRDLNLALDFSSPPTLVLPADMPHLSHEILEDFLAKAIASPGVVVNMVTSRGPTGVSLFKARGGVWQDIEYFYHDALIDVDTPEDFSEAERTCS